jgi:hypothetical protein
MKYSLFAIGLFLIGSFGVVACEEGNPDDLGIKRPQRKIDTEKNEPSPDAGPGGLSCSNGVKDGDETDVDCGGATCPACANAKSCNAASDCISNTCTAGKCANDQGCSDGTREAFTSPTQFPNIAGCAGAWSVPGLGTTTPQCRRAAGNTGSNPTGKDCNVADLCQVGWHVCETGSMVQIKSNGGGCASAGIATGSNVFFASRQSGTGGAMCGVGSNDLFGCGDIGIAPDPTTCGPLDRFSNDLCAALPATWSCGMNGNEEVNNVTKTAIENGGVLCCRD